MSQRPSKVNTSKAKVKKAEARPYLEAVLELAQAIPEESLKTLPTDLSKNLKHYLYGHPKEA